MADLSYNAFLNSQDNKTTKSSPLSYDSYLKSKEPKESVGKKVVGFGKELIKDAVGTLLVKPAQRTTEALTRTLAPNSLAAKGYETMADEGKGQDFKLPGIGNYNVSTVKPIGQGGGKQIAGEALKSGTYLASFTKPVSTFLKGAPLAKQIAYGVGEGAAFGAGGAMESGLNNKEILKQTAIGGVLGGIAPVAIKGVSKLLGGVKKEIPKALEIKTANDIHTQAAGGKISNEVLDNLKKNPIGVKELPTDKNGMVTLFRNGELKEGTPQSYSLKQSEGQIPVKVPKENILVNYNSNEVDNLYNKSFTKEQIDAGYLNQRKLNKLESEVYAITPSSKIKQPIKNRTDIPEIVKPLNESKSKSDPNWKFYEDTASKDPEYTPQTHELRTQAITRDLQDPTKGIDYLWNSATGRVKGAEDYPATFAKDFLLRSGKLSDEQAAKLISNRFVESQAGSSLQAVKSANNASDYVQSVNTKLQEIVKQKKVINNKVINGFLDGLECK